MMPKITEIMPDDIPDWARQAMSKGQFFNVALARITQLEEDKKALQDEVESPFDRRAADTLARACVRSISEGHFHIFTRSKIADALLDYLDIGGDGPSSIPEWVAKYDEQALSNSEGKPKCPKHETGGGPCYCDKQGGSDL